jgi:hypothetical protein
MYFFTLIFAYIDMTNWIIDEQWLDESASWFIPPSPQLISNKKTPPFDSFGDYIYPPIERLVRL